MKKTQHVRIIDSLYTTVYGVGAESIVEAMIGGIFEVRDVDYFGKTFGVYEDKEKSDWRNFEFSDVQEVCLDAVVDGYVLGVGDIIEGKAIFGFYVHDGNVMVSSGTNEDTYIYHLCNVRLKDITPLYNPPAETIKIGEKFYDKSEVEKALASLKEIK